MQGWEFALLLKIAHFKERPWAICSHHSLKKSEFKQIAKKMSDSLKKNHIFVCFDSFYFLALVALYKRATMSDSLLLLFTKERQERVTIFHEQIALLLTKKQAIP